MSRVAFPRLPSFSHSRMMAAAAMFALVLGCQSVTNPPEELPAPTTEERGADVSLGGGAFPDSVQIEFAKDSKSRVLSFTPSDSGVLIRFEAPLDLGADTLWLHLWTRGVRHQSIGFAKVRGKTSCVVRHRSELASQTLARLDSLQDAGNLPSGSPTQQFLAAMGDLVVQGDATTSRWWQTSLPEGLTKAQIDSTVLATYVGRGVGVDSILAAGKVSLDRSAVQDTLEKWLRDGAITKERYESVMGTGTVDKSGPVVTFLAPSTSDVSVESGMATYRVKVGVSDPAGVAKVRIGSTVLEASPWEATLVLKEGENLFDIVAQDRLGNESSSSLRIVRRASTGDLVPPSIERTLPKADTIRVPWSTRSVDLSWKVADDSLLDAVKLGSRVLTGSEGVYSTSSTLVVGRNAVVLSARDRHGNEAFDTLIVHRAADTIAPTLKLVLPSETTSSVPWGTDSAEVVVQAQDDMALATVRIGGVVVESKGSVFRRKVQLAVGRNEIVVEAIDSSDERQTLKLAIERASDGRSPVYELQGGVRDTTLPVETKDFTVAWKVTDLDLAWVKIADETITGTDGVYRRTVALTGDSMWIRLDAQDAAGNSISDSILVRRLAPPEVDPISGPVEAVVKVRATVPAGVSVEYALGSASSWSKFVDPLLVESSRRVFLRARRGDVVSSVVERIYAFAPRIEPAGKAFTAPESVKVLFDGDGAIEISTDGTTWRPYEAVLVLNATTKVHARVKLAGVVSPVVRAQFDYVPPKADLVPPEVVRSEPVADSLEVGWATRSIGLTWKVTDDSLLDAVSFGTRILTSSTSVFAATAELKVGRNVLVLTAKDRHGNPSYDTVIVRRAADTKAPTFNRIEPLAEETSVAFAIDSFEVVVQVEDDLALRSVRIADMEVPGVAGVFRRKVALRVGTNEVLVAAVDSSENGSGLTVKIQRASDGRSPLTERQPGTADTVVPSERTEYTAAWKVTDQDSLISVKIESEPAVGKQGVYSKTVALSGDSTWIRIDAVDEVGNLSSDSFLVRRLAPPEVSPASAAVAAAQAVSARAGMGAEIEYALGATTATWTSYKTALSVTSSTRLFFRTRLGSVLSSTVERIYVFAPSISPAAKSFTVPETVSVAANGIAQVEFSVDGTTWSAYTKPIVVSKTTKLQARSRIGDFVSAATSVQYDHVPLAITPPSGGYSTSQSVSITAVKGAALEYAFGAPENWVAWTGMLSIGGNSKLYARVAGTGVVTSAEYAFPPRVQPLGKSFVSPESLTVLGVGADALEYSLDGLTWTTYTRKLYLKSSMTLRVRAKVGATYSPVVTQEYVYTPLRAVTGAGYEWGVGTMFSPGNPVAYWLKGDSLWTSGSSTYPFEAWSGTGATGERKFLGTGYEQVWTSKGSPRLTGASTFFLKKGGDLWAVGSNQTGALGDGTKSDAPTPIHVLDGVRSVSMGVGATMVVTTAGALYAMGGNDYGSLGLGTTAYDVALKGPTLVLSSGVKQAAMGKSHSLVLKTDGTLWTAGQNWRGLRGLGGTPEVQDQVDSNFTPVMTGVRNIATNAHFSLVVKDDGSLWGFGQNDYGQLGTGDTKDVLAPSKIMDGVDTVALGEWHALILMKTGDLYAIGYGAYGALGTNATTNAIVPTKVAENIEWISAGAVNSFFRNKDGGLYAMGSNGSSAAPLFPGITETKVISPRYVGW